MGDQTTWLRLTDADGDGDDNSCLVRQDRILAVWGGGDGEPTEIEIENETDRLEVTESLEQVQAMMRVADKIVYWTEDGARYLMRPAAERKL